MLPRALLITVIVAIPAAASAPTLDHQFEQAIRPFVTKYCVGCHSGATPAAQFDLKAYTTLETVTRDYPRWALVLERLTAKEMPPKPMPHRRPTPASRSSTGFSAVRAEEIRKNAGDPGVVLARRLSNAEYNYTIRDLTGQDMQPAREFPVDPANPAGFDNSGESLTMSPALLNKYLQAAREVADHMVLTPDGIDFAPHPMLVETDRDRYAIQRIVDFYARQPTDFADYFQAAWRFKHRAALGKPGATTASRSPRIRRSAPNICRWCGRSCKTRTAVGPVAKLQAMWRAFARPRRNPIAPTCCEQGASRCAISWSRSAATRRCSSPRRK